MSFVERCVRLTLCSALFALTAAFASAQVTATAPPLSTTLADYNNRWDAFGGFSYARFTTTVGHALRANTFGFKGQVTGWLTPVIGLTAATNQYYGTVNLNSNPYGFTQASISQHMFLFGPEFRLLRHPKLTVDYHLLVGGTYGIFDSSLHGVVPNQVDLYNNQLAFALATGGSFDYNLNPQFSVRLITDFQPTHYGLALQKEFAGSVGVVYKWGAIKK